MEEFYERYERPPGPDRIFSNATENNSEPYSNGGFYSTGEETYCDFSNDFNKRRSWQDMMDQHSSSDIGSFNSSYSTVITNKSNGKRRSWDKLIESDENLQKHDKLVVSILPEPSHPISFMMVKEGRLGKVNLYNKKQKRDKYPSVSSKASTLSEFILVPKPISMESVAEILNEQKIKETSAKPFDTNDSNTLLCHWPARKTTFALIATLGLCIFAGVVGYFARKYMDSKNNNYSLNLSNTKDSLNYNLNVYIGNTMVVLYLNSSSAGKEVNTFVDFKNKFVIYQPAISPNYCFVKILNSSNLPNKEALKSAAALSSREDHKYLWSQDWYWQLDRGNSATKDTITADSDLKDICINSNNIYVVKPSLVNHQSFQCYACNSVCVPDYGLVKVSDQEWSLNILKEICFWFSSNELPQLFTTQATNLPMQNIWSNNAFLPSQQFPQQQTFQSGQASLNVNNRFYPSLNNPNGAFWFNNRKTR